MDGIGRTCLGCQADLGPTARFCPKCGRPAGNAAPGPVPGGPPPGDSPGSAGPDALRPGNQQPAPDGGPGFTVAAAPEAPPPAGWGPTVTQPAFPRPYQAPLPPATRPRALPGPGPVQSGPLRPSPQQPPLAPSYPPPAFPYPPLASPPAYQGPAFQQQPSDPRGFEPFRPYPPPGPLPAGQPEGPPRQPPRRHDGQRSRSSLALWIIVLVLLAGGGVAGVLIAHPFGHPALRQTASTDARPAGGPASGGASASPTGPAAASATAATSPAAAPVTEQQAATSVATMLSQSVSDRAAISSAASDVGDCGPSLNSDPKVFSDAARSRKSLLASLTAMPGRAALPPALISDLTQAWQASIAADQAYAEWANDEVVQGCVQNDTSDPGYKATVTPNENATTYKTAFVAQWNPVAARYGLTQYQQGQL